MHIGNISYASLPNHLARLTYKLFGRLRASLGPSPQKIPKPNINRTKLAPNLPSHSDAPNNYSLAG